MERVKTNIYGLDAMLYGGIPKQSQLIITGGPGTGKTLLSFEYIYKGAELGEVGVFLTFDEDPERVLQNVRATFPNLDKLDQLISEKKIIITGNDMLNHIREQNEPSNYQFGKLVSEMEYLVSTSGAKRIAIDSISILEMLVNDNNAYRKSLLALTTNLRRLGLTSFVTSEANTLEKEGLKFKEEYFIFDGILSMYQKGEEEKRVLQMEIIKIRGSKHSFVTAPYEITESGFRFVSVEQLA